MHKIKSLFKTIFVNFLVLLLLILATNMVLGFYLKSSKPSRANLPNYENNRGLAEKIFYDYKMVAHEYAPFMGWKTLLYSGETLTIGSDGYRKVSNTNSIKSRLKVGLFGGSTLWGEGASDDGTIPSIVAKLNPHIEVYNFGQLAFNSRQNLAVLTNLYSSGKKLDLVIFYDGVNDAAFLCPKQVSVPGHRMEPVFKERLYSGSKYLINKALYKYFVQNIVNFTNRIRVNYLGQKMESEYLCYRDEDKIDKIAQGMLNNWRLAEQMVVSNGGKFIGVLQPMAYRGKAKIDHLEKMDQELGKSMNMVYDKILAKIDTSSSIQVLNLVDAFDRNEYIYIDFCHVSTNGNKIIANRITEFINHTDYLPVD